MQTVAEVWSDEPHNPRLLEAMRVMSLGDNAGTREAFYRELLVSTFVTPLSPEAELDLVTGKVMPAIPHVVPAEAPRSFLGPVGGAPLLRSELTAELSLHPAVRAAYLFQTAIGSGRVHMVVGLDVPEPLDNAGRDGLMQSLGETLRRHIPRDDYVDVMLLDGDALSHIADCIAPFYEKR